AVEAVNDAAKGLDDAKARIEEIKIQLQTSRDELTQLSDSKRKEKLEQELAQLRQRKERDVKRLNEQIAGIEDKLSRNPVSDTVEFRENQALYKSDFDGLITQIHVKTGEIITPGTSLVTLIKDTSILEGHTFVENQDIGNLSRGQQVKIKYFAYPYQEYGIAKGVISSIATTPSGLPGKETKYLVRVVLGTKSISRRLGKPRPLEIGLEGIAEIKTGEKRFIELLFSPISSFFAQPEESA
ncbi:MAG: HlyD family efflux transporter periplasmic adaptor subunit, partial [Gammaproteobacteria bacterium]